jgi:signal transduction histidine kinase
LTSTAKPKASIVVIDDTPANLRLLTQMLAKRDYKVRPMPSGEMGLRTVQAALPDLILLDVNMPGMNGYEVCEHLKRDPETRDVPVIFISALGETLDKVKAFEVGGIDYITKPFHIEEVIARVETQLELKQNRDALQSHSLMLEELLEEKKEFLDLAAHELKNPLNVLRGYAEWIEESHKDAPEEVEEIARKMLLMTQNMHDLVIKILDINMLELGKHPLNLNQLDLASAARSVVRKFEILAAEKSQRVSFKDENPAHYAYADEKAVFRILDNLISNAIKFSPEGAHIEVTIKESDAGIQCQIRDTGPGLTTEDHKNLFKKYAHLSAKPTKGESSSRLGLSIAHALANGMGGKLWCESTFGHGARFFLELPKHNQEQQIKPILRN